MSKACLRLSGATLALTPLFITCTVPSKAIPTMTINITSSTKVRPRARVKEGLVNIAGLRRDSHQLGAVARDGDDQLGKIGGERAVDIGRRVRHTERIEIEVSVGGRHRVADARRNTFAGPAADTAIAHG